LIEQRLVLFKLFGFIPVSVISILDIVIVTLVLERLFVLIRGTRSAQMLVGLLVVLAVSVAAPLLRLDALAWLLQQLTSILLIVLVILFQPELRRVLLDLGRSPIFSRFLRSEPSRVIDQVANGAEQISEQGYGALIVLARQAQLAGVLESGVPLDATVSGELLTTIFTPRSPLHDQAVVILGERIIAARCTLPLAEDVEDQRLGTRHRAALGLSQESDAVVVVVSEETQVISLAVSGQLRRNLRGKELRLRLTEVLGSPHAGPPRNGGGRT
jgi:diadenylate cyclase